VVASKNNFLDHIKLLRKAVAENGAELIIAGDSMAALVRRENVFMELRPQFIATIDGARQYVDTLIDEAWQFVGWLPYRNKRWPIASDKLTFKRYALGAGLRVPELSTDPAGTVADVVVKRASSSFGEQVKGPFRAGLDCPLNIAEGEYYERFVQGRLLKLWFWNATPVCAELDVMPLVVGDGLLSLRDLILRRARLNAALGKSQTDALLSRSEAVLKYFGTDLSAVLPYGQRQIVEFRYGSVLMLRQDRRIVDFTSVPSGDAAWTSSVARVGQVLYDGIPQMTRSPTLFTVDAVVDDKNELWLLEMNSNPTVHPLAYSPMLKDLLAAAEARSGVSPPRASPIAAARPEATGAAPAAIS
jgi:hypothetical protein